MDNTSTYDDRDKTIDPANPLPKRISEFKSPIILLIEAEPICACTPALAIITYELL